MNMPYTKSQNDAMFKLIKSYQIPMFAGFPMDFPWISHGFPMAFPMDFPGRFAAMRHGEVIANLGESSQAKPMTWGGFNL
jgi:hypothetical protein